MEWFKGKKTYIVAVAGALVVGLFFVGVIDEQIATAALGALGFGAVATLRDAIGTG